MLAQVPARIRVTIRILPVGLARVYPGPFLFGRHQFARAWAIVSHLIIGITQFARTQRQAAAANTAIQHIVLGL